MEGGELFSRIQERADTAFTERGSLLGGILVCMLLFIIIFIIVVFCLLLVFYSVSQKNHPTLKQYCLKLLRSILMVWYLAEIFRSL